MRDSLVDGIGYVFVRLLAALVQRLPLGIALGLGRNLGGWGYFWMPRRTRVAYANLKSAFPGSSVRQRREWIREMFRNLGMNGAEILRFPGVTKKEVEEHVIQRQGYEAYLEHRWKGKGLILLTAHFGNWEYSQIVEAVRGRPVTVLARRQKHRRLDDFLNSLRRCHGTVSVGKGGGVRDVIRTLRGGGCIGMLADQAGGDDGVWVRFFGRLTLAPRGPMAMALKLGVTILPAFFVRTHGPSHELIFEPSLEWVRTGDPERDIQVSMQNYIHLLESYLTRYPSQWLWGHKRWKRTRTKRILVLSDGKPGHVKQSEALVREILQSGRQKTPPCEISVEGVEVEFQSAWHRRLFYLFALFFISWAQGRLGGLRFFLTPASAGKLERATPDLILSAGAALVPLNLCLVRENLAKSVVVMKPGFPYNLFRYDLALIPAHDGGWMPAGHFKIQGILSGPESEELEAAGRLLGQSLRNPERIRWSLFLGGRTRNFNFSLSDAQIVLGELEQAAESEAGDFLVTTSRRTPPAVVEFLREKLRDHPRCQLFCVAAENPRPEVASGMMALADSLIVTEDSLSMISEAIRSGKRVVVVKMNSGGLPRKHSRFQEILKKEWGVPVVEAARLGEVLGEESFPSFQERWQEEQIRIREKVGSLL